MTISTPQSPQSQYYQYLSTPDFYFTRHTSPTTHHVNDGNSLFVRRPLKQPFQTYDPRRIGTDPSSFDIAFINRFNYDTLLDIFYNAGARASLPLLWSILGKLVKLGEFYFSFSLMTLCLLPILLTFESAFCTIATTV